MGADEDVHFPFGQFLHRALDFLGGLEAAHHFDPYGPVGEAVAKTVVVLLGEQGSGHQYGDLTTAVYGDKSCAHRHFCLAEADIAANQTIHRLGREHVVAHGFDGGLLIRRLLEGESGAEGFVIELRIGKGVTFAGGAAGINVQQLGGYIADLLCGLALGLLPSFRAQPVQWR